IAFDADGLAEAAQRLKDVARATSELQKTARRRREHALQHAEEHREPSAEVPVPPVLLDVDCGVRALHRQALSRARSATSRSTRQKRQSVTGTRIGTARCGAGLLRFARWTTRTRSADSPRRWGRTPRPG